MRLFNFVGDYGTLQMVQINRVNKILVGDETKMIQRHNKGMQPDFGSLARASAADAGR